MKKRTYTHHKALWINKQIGRKLRVIVRVILENISGVRSIILVGGFGKGEGSVEITRDGEVECKRDFDLAVVVDRMPRERTHQKLYVEIYRSLGLPNPQSKPFRYSTFVVDIHFLRSEDLIYPDIWFYDLKAASQLLYGEDVRNLIPWGKEDVPLSSGLRILLEKVCGLLGVFSLTYHRAGEPSEEERKLLIFECYKTFVEIGTAVSILAHKYEPKYVTRAKNLEKFYGNRFPDFAHALPGLPKKVKAYTNFKLKPNFADIHEHPIELWFSTKESLCITIRLYLRRYLGITIKDMKTLPDQMKIVARYYYRSFLRSFICAKLGFLNRAVIDVASFLFQALMNVEYTYVVARNMGKLRLDPLRRIYMSPSLKFFQAGIMILSALNRDGTIDNILLEKAADELRYCIPVEASTLDKSGWEALRKHFLKAYSLFKGHHFVK